jgi:hypothetical protein
MYLHQRANTSTITCFDHNKVEIINLLESLLGKEISTIAMPSNKDMETEPARLAKEMEERERKQRELT